MQGLSRQGLNVGDDSAAATQTISASNQFNAFLDYILDGLDGVRQIPPTTRTDDSRIWGPYNDTQHDGYQVEVVIDRVDAGFDWALKYLQNSQESFTLGGGFFVPTVTLKEGEGAFNIDAKAGRDHFGGDGGIDSLDVTYITDMSPKQVAMHFTADPGDGGENLLDYAYVQTDAGDVRAIFKMTGNDPNITTLQYDVKWNGAGEGFADVTILAGNWSDAGVDFKECWDSAQKVEYSNMIFDGGPSPIGNPDTCVTFTDLP
jgi:hypothetical protein